MKLHADRPSRVDSLRDVLQSNIGDLTRVDVLCDLSIQYRQVDPDSTIYFGEKALLLSDQIEYSFGKSRSLYALGIGFHKMGNYDSALHIYNQGLKIAIKNDDQSGQSRLINNIGLIYWNKGEYAKALARFQNSLSLDIELNEKYGESRSLNNIGLLYRSMNDFESSFQYLKKSYYLLLEQNDLFGLAQCTNNIGLVLENLNQYDSSIFYLKMSLDYSIKSGILCHKTYPLLGLAQTLLTSNKIDSTIYYANRVLDFEKSDCLEPKVKSTALYTLGLAYFHQGELELSKGYLNESIGIAKDISFFSGAFKSYQALSELYESIGEYEQALYYYNLFHQTKESIHNDQVSADVARLEASYEFDKEKELLLKMQAKEELQYQDKIRKKSIIENIAIGGTVLFILLFAFVLQQYSRKKKDNELITDQKNQLEQLSAYKDGLIQMIAHDMKNSLNTIVSYSESVPKDKRMKTIGYNGRVLLNLVVDMLDIHKFEEANMSLHYQLVGMDNLVHAAKRQVEHMMEIKNLDLVQNVPKEVLLNVDCGLFIRVLVNLISNAVKFSPAGGTVTVTGKTMEDDNNYFCQLSVSDEGKGIPSDDLPFIFDKFWQGKLKYFGMPVSSGLGLTFCKLAVQAHDGEIYARSQEGHGTTVVIEIPLLRGVNTPSEQKFDNSRIEELVVNNELDVIMKYKQELEQFEVYEVGAINQVLKRLDSEEIISRWGTALRATVADGNAMKYRELLAEIA